MNSKYFKAHSGKIKDKWSPVQLMINKDTKKFEIL